MPTEPTPRPVTLDRSTQTEPSILGRDTGQERVPAPKRAQSLHLEDALPPGQPTLEAHRAKLHRVPGMEEEDEEQEEDEEGRSEQEKELSWTSSVEETIQPTTITGLQREDFQDGTCSPEESSSASPLVRTSEQNLNPRSGPLSTIQEGEKQSLCVTSSSYASSLHNQLLPCDPLHAVIEPINCFF